MIQLVGAKLLSVTVTDGNIELSVCIEAQTDPILIRFTAQQDATDHDRHNVIMQLVEKVPVTTYVEQVTDIT